MRKWQTDTMDDMGKMKRSDRVPDYLIDGIARHVNAILFSPFGSDRHKNAERLLKKEIKRLETYKSKPTGASPNVKPG